MKKLTFTALALMMCGAACPAPILKLTAGKPL